MCYKYLTGRRDSIIRNEIEFEDTADSVNSEAFLNKTTNNVNYELKHIIFQLILFLYEKKQVYCILVLIGML